MRTTGKVRRHVANLLLLLGLLAIGVWAWASIRGSLYQSWADWAFDRRTHGQPATVTEYLNEKTGEVWDSALAWCGLRAAPNHVNPRPVIRATRTTPQPPPRPVLRDGDLIGRLVIPRLHLRAMIREGTWASTLEVALGHISGTAMPGQNGNAGLAGHRDTLFRRLKDVRENDLIDVQTTDGDYTYQVDHTEIVTPKTVDVLRAGNRPEITLVTCYPFHYIGPAPDRFIVKAHLVSQPSQNQNDSQTPKEKELVRHETKPPKTSAAVFPRAHEHSANRKGTRKENFRVSENHSLQVAPGISVGVSWADASRQRVSGWVWDLADRRTIWLRRQKTSVPVIFTSRKDGRTCELVITNVSGHAAAGYLLVSGAE